MVLKYLYNLTDNFLNRNNNISNKPPLYTEEEILEAMDRLVTKEKKVGGYKKEELTCKVPKVGVWSLFKYMTDSPYGISVPDKRFYFTIPCGWEYGADLKMWYLGVFFNSYAEDVFEFYNSYELNSIIPQEDA